MDICAFSENGKYFSLISPDGRLKVWDAETNVLKQEYTPDLHLSAPPTCLRWISLGSGGVSTRRKRKSSQVDLSNLKDVQNTYIALGTPTGKILLYSVEQAKVDSILSDESTFDARDTNITCIDWSDERGLYSCSSDSTLREWNISENGTRQTYKLKIDDKNSYSSKITAIKLVPRTQIAPGKLVLLGCCRIKLYNLDSNSVLRDFTGHSADITHLSIANFSKNGKLFAVSACKNERIISLWNLAAEESKSSPTKSKQKRKIQITAFCSFLLEDVPSNIVSSVDDAQVTSLILAAVTRTGSLHYYSHILNGTSAVKAIKPNVTVQVATEEARPMPALCCHLTNDLKDAITLAYLSSQAVQSVTFEKIAPDLSNKSQVLIRPSMDCSKRAKEKNDDASKMRHDHQDDETRQERVTYLDGGGTNKANNKRNAAGKKIEVPMESRLANLSLEMGGTGEKSQQNMGQLLVQGLHSNDRKLLLSVLQCTDARIAYNSVSRLPPRYLNPLLQHITEMLTRKTSQAKAACVWLSAMVRAHASLLLATANTEPTAERIAAVLSALAVKRSSLGALLSLKGRLALTLGQLEERTADTPEEDNAMLEYRDSSSDSESIDQDALGPINRVASDDENSWDEDGTAGDQNDASHRSDSEMDG